MRIGKLLVNHAPALALPRSAFLRGRMRVSEGNTENDIQKPYGHRTMSVLILNSRVHTMGGCLPPGIRASWGRPLKHTYVQLSSRLSKYSRVQCNTLIARGIESHRPSGPRSALGLTTLTV